MAQIHNLSTDGAIASPSAVMKRLMENFMVSDYSQTLFYGGEVASLRYIYSGFDNDVRQLELDITASLQTMYSRYFANVEVFAEATLNGDGVSVDIAMEISVLENGAPYTLSEAVNTKNVLALYNSK